jgi:hypothetical protein
LEGIRHIGDIHAATSHVVSRDTAVRLGPVSGSWISHTHHMPAQTISEDRVLHQALGTRGDVRRPGGLFGRTLEGAERCARATDRPNSSICLYAFASSRID